MINYVSRDEVIQELDIDDYILAQYEKFLELPDASEEGFDINVAKLVARLHEMIKAGLSLNDIKQLSFVAEQYHNVIPQLKNFRDFSPHHHLKELVKYYNEMINELGHREEHYQAKIANMENVIQKMQLELEKNGIAHDQIESFQYETQRYKSEIVEREEVLTAMQQRLTELDVQLQELHYLNNEKNDEIDKLKAELEYYTSSDPVLKKRSAVDIQALLKKKEKEIELKHQREIFDLKKQVDLMLEQKEKEWFTGSRNRTQSLAS